MGLFFVLCFSAASFFLSIQTGQCLLIVGGQESIPHSRPYMAAILRESHFICGGTLINEGWVLTAASCASKERVQVALGAHSRQNEREEGRQIIGIANKFVYPRYNLFVHDLMLLKLQKKAVLNQNVQIIQLPSTFDDIQPGTSCLVAGWGQQTYGTELSNALHEVNITIIERSICNNTYRSITINMLCAGDMRGGKGTCQGDGGSPLICGAEQKGILSFGPAGCGNKKYPDVFTRLTQNYVAWIKKIILDNP